MCPYSLSASKVLQYHVCRLSEHGCQFDQLIAYLQQNQQRLSAGLPAENALTVWSGQRLKIAGIGIAWQESFNGTDSFLKAQTTWQKLCSHSQNLRNQIYNATIFPNGNADQEYPPDSQPAPLAANTDNPICRKETSAQFDGNEADSTPTWPLVFGSFGFSPSTSSILLIPALAVVSTDDGTWLWQARLQGENSNSPGCEPVSSQTRSDKLTSNPRQTITKGYPSHPTLAVAKPATLQAKMPSRGGESTPVCIEKSYPHLNPQAWMQAVGRARSEIQSGRAEKIVLARDIQLRFDQEISLLRVTNYLANQYPNCWTYAIDDLVGASPEMLASVLDGKLLCRVLAGSALPTRENYLFTDPKEQLEHRLAVQSAEESLVNLGLDLQVPSPRLLRLGYVTHLATDITAENLADQGVTSLSAAGALHPTAAVCGKPREVAAARLSELEAMNRGRYAAPIGWMDASGEGEWAIALRCAERHYCRGDIYRVIAGAGIMGDSNPQRELVETETKMSPMIRALTA